MFLHSGDLQWSRLLASNANKDGTELCNGSRATLCMLSEPLALHRHALLAFVVIPKCILHPHALHRTHHRSADVGRVIAMAAIVASHGMAFTISQRHRPVFPYFVQSCIRLDGLERADRTQNLSQPATGVRECWIVGTSAAPTVRVLPYTGVRMRYGLIVLIIPTFVLKPVHV